MNESHAAEVKLTLESGVARLLLDRADKRNALTEAMWRAVGDLAAESVERGARVLVLEGAGAHFSAGADIAELRDQLADPQRLIDNAEQVQTVQRSLRRLPIPTLALIRGHCVGGGLGLALCCDLRVASADARFALTPVRLGLHYSLADTRQLASIIGLARAREMLLTACPVEAGSAGQWGLINRVCEDPDTLSVAVEETIKTWLSASPEALAATKRVLSSLDGTGDDSAEDLNRLFLASFESTDFAEGAAAFVEKRAPRFSRN